MANSVKNALLLAVGCAFLLCICAIQPAFAILDGNLREQLEFLDYSEVLIKDTCYARTGSQVFNRENRRFMRGVREHGARFIYEPDVYLWNLAMGVHQKKMASLRAKAKRDEQSVLPAVIKPTAIMPSAPPYTSPAQFGGVGYPQRVDDIKQRLINHMNSLDGGEIPALLPALPNLPKGRKADSYDASY